MMRSINVMKLDTLFKPFKVVGCCLLACVYWHGGCRNNYPIMGLIIYRVWVIWVLMGFCCSMGVYTIVSSC